MILRNQQIGQGVKGAAIVFYASAIFNGGAYSITAVRTYVCPSRPSIRPVPYVTLLVSVRYLLKGLLYWIETLYTGI